MTSIRHSNSKYVLLIETTVVGMDLVQKKMFQIMHTGMGFGGKYLRVFLTATYRLESSFFFYKIQTSVTFKWKTSLNSLPTKMYHGKP